MDGVLVDGEPLHFEAVNRLLAEEGKSISLEAYKPYMGTKSGWSEMIAAMSLSKPASYYSDRYRDRSTTNRDRDRHRDRDGYADRYRYRYRDGDRKSVV